MPATMLLGLAKRAGVSVARAEHLWSEAKSVAKEGGRENDYPYIVGILKKMLRLEMIDLLGLGWDPQLLAEAVLSKSSASFLRSRGIQITNELRNVGSDTPTNWKSIALNLRLLMNEYFSALSSGKKECISAPRAFRMIRKSQTTEDLVSVYTRLFPDIDSQVLESIVEELESDV